jgi:hypothetical protein
MPPLTAVISGIEAEAVIRPRQADDHDNWLPVSAVCRGARKQPDLDDKIISPIRSSKERGVRRDRNLGTEPGHLARNAAGTAAVLCARPQRGAADTQGFVLAVRKDVLSRVDIAADETIFLHPGFLRGDRTASCSTADGASSGDLVRRSRSAALDWTGSTDCAALGQRRHKKHHVRSFRWRRWMR